MDSQGDHRIDLAAAGGGAQLPPALGLAAELGLRALESSHMANGPRKKLLNTSLHMVAENKPLPAEMGDKKESSGIATSTEFKTRVVYQDSEGQAQISSGESLESLIHKEITPRTAVRSVGRQLNPHHSPASAFFFSKISVSEDLSFPSFLDLPIPTPMMLKFTQ